MLQPLYDRVLVEKSERAGVSAGGIIIPDAVRDRGQTGRVVAVGSGRVLKNGQSLPIDVEIGNVIVFGKAMEVQYENKTYLMVKEEDILAVVE